MTSFVETILGDWVNLDHVVRTRREQGQHGDRIVLLDTEDRPLGKLYPHDHAGKSLMQRGTFLVAASAGQIATIITVSNNDRRPTQQDVWTRRLHIIAWWLDDDVVSPVLCDDTVDGLDVFIEGPNGSESGLTNASIGFFDNLAAAQEAHLKLAQDKFDSMQKILKPLASEGTHG
jgi:hypothetical protein